MHFLQLTAVGFGIAGNRVRITKAYSRYSTFVVWEECSMCTALYGSLVKLEFFHYTLSKGRDHNKETVHPSEVDEVYLVAC